MITTATPERVDAPAGVRNAVLRVPEQSAADLAVATAVAIFAVVCVWPFFTFMQFSFVDEGIVLQGAVRVLHGQVPYRDFFSFYTPGSYYLYAVLFGIFGASIQVARAVLLVYAALFAWITYMLARRASSRRASAMAALLLALVCVSTSFVVGHNWDSTAAAMIALYFAAWLLQTGAARWAFLCGAMTGATAMIDQSRGGGLLLGLAVAGCALCWLQPRRWKARHLIWFTSGAAMPVAVATGYFVARHAGHWMITAWFWPIWHYSAVNAVAFGYTPWTNDLRQVFASAPPAQRAVMLVIFSGLIAVALFPLLAVIATGLVTVRVWLEGRTARPDRLHAETPAVVVFAILGGCVLSGVLVTAALSGRMDWYHIAILAPFSFYLLPLLIDVRVLPVPNLARLRPLFAGCLLPAFLLLNMLLGLNARSAIHKTWTRRGVIKTASPDHVLPYLQEHVAAGQKVLIYPYLPIYSFLSATMSPTRFEYLQPGLHTPEQFAEAQRELEADKTPVVLYQIRFRDEIAQAWPSTPAAVVAADPMGDYIFRHYRMCRALFGAHEPFAYMVRDDLACP